MWLQTFYPLFNFVRSVCWRSIGVFGSCETIYYNFYNWYMIFFFNFFEEFFRCLEFLVFSQCFCFFQDRIWMFLLWFWCFLIFNFFRILFECLGFFQDHFSNVFGFFRIISRMFLIFLGSFFECFLFFFSYAPKYADLWW